MPKLTFIEASGTEHEVEAPDNISAMAAALDFNVPGIDGDCGGHAACATCHVYVDERWTGKVGPADEHEVQMLELAEGMQENSRLACQIILTADLDGLVLRMPEGQF